MNKLLFILGLASHLFIYSSALYADEIKKWYFTSNLVVGAGSYTNSATKDNQTNGKLILDLDYLDRTTIQFTSGINQFTFNDSNQNLTQYTNGASIKQNYFSDVISGKISIKAGYINLSGRQITRSNTYFGKTEYLNYNYTFYSSLTYAFTRYGMGNNPFEVSQLKPTIGIKLITDSLWANVSGIFISNSLDNTYNAYSASISYFPTLRSPLLPLSISVGITGGEQQFAVDEELMLVYNTEDILEQSYYISAQWNLQDDLFLKITGGKEKYLNSADTSYELNYITSTLAKTW